MELTLIPIAAILILLSGTAAPSRPHLTQSAGPSVVRFWFGMEAVRAAAFTVARATSGSDYPRIHRGFSNPGREQQATATGRVKVAARLFSQVQFQTRFGVESGAYRSTAPPSA